MYTTVEQLVKSDLSQTRIPPSPLSRDRSETEKGRCAGITPEPAALAHYVPLVFPGSWHKVGTYVQSMATAA